MENEVRFYLDTSIWLDFFEKRDEPDFPKGTWAKNLIRKIINDNNEIIFSDANMLELINNSYSQFEIEEFLSNLKEIIICIEATEKEIGKAKDLAQKRDIPKHDVLHALIARDNSAILIDLDAHFKKLTDIITSHTPKEFI